MGNMEPRVMSMTGALLQRYNTGTKLPKQEAMDRLVADMERRQKELKTIYDPGMMSEYMHMTRNRSGQGMESDLTNKKRAMRKRGKSETGHSDRIASSVDCCVECRVG